MRSRNILRRSQLLLRNSAFLHPALGSHPRPCLPGLSPPIHDSSFRKMSSVVEGSVLSGASDPPMPPVVPPENTEAEQDTEGSPLDPSETSQAEQLSKVKIRRTRTVTTATKEAETIELPEDLDIVWLPQESASVDAPSKSGLPPPEVFEEVLNKLLITQHPQVQHRATYPTGADPPVEPTLGLYCPIEGGEYIIDATVRELANTIGAEVLVLDSAQLAGGEWGKFGKAANSLQLPVNPLHVPSQLQIALQSATEAAEAYEQADYEDVSPQLMTLTLLAHAQRNGVLAPSSRRATSRSKVKVFFDTLVNSTSKSLSSSSSSTRPQIIYVRDFSLLAPSSSVWYPPLLSAVRQRRKGPISRPSSPISNPITIVFGMTPSLTPPISTGAGPTSNFVNYLDPRYAPTAVVVHPDPMPERVDWSESDSAEKAREQRLQDRLQKWEKHELALFNELPKLSTTNEDEPSSDVQKPEIIVLGSGPRGLGRQPDFRGPKGGDFEKRTSFFRTSVVVPAKRSHSLERATRMSRRREINELSIRMGVGLVGGNVEDVAAADHFNVPATPEDSPVQEGAAAEAPSTPTMWEDWGNRVEVWPNVKKIADSAVGRVLSTPAPRLSPEQDLEPTVVPWDYVQSAWSTRKALRDRKKTWLKNESPSNPEEPEKPTDKPPVDEVIERVKSGVELDPYEQRLLGSIVDAGSMPTSFSHVHLPPHTIDSVRTIVSLPLLHPNAFRHGILKQHSMSGCLLFGPPGTGKTLVVRALAKDAGCRMLAITPSDIMDMYVGEGEKLVRAVFSLARRLSPCVVFLDEIDALFGARVAARDSSGAATAHRGVITEFMQEMDGLKSSKEDGIVVIGATNRPFDLDDAVLRRLPRRLLVDLPGAKEREGILQILLRDEVLGPDVTLEMLSKQTESFSGSDLRHLCVSAALDAVKERFNVPWKPIPSENVSDTPTKPTDPIEETVTSPADPALPSTTPSSDKEAPELETEVKSEASPEASTAPATPQRILHLRHFTKALKEITPSSSESSSSLTDLRKWNDEFGEGRRGKKHSPWGKGLFGFVDAKKAVESSEGKVGAANASLPPSSLEP